MRTDWAGGLENLIICLQLHIPNSRPLRVQTTPPNILYMLTYLTTVVARRDFTGSNATCKSIVHPRVMRETENIARTEDMWDSGCELSNVLKMSPKNKLI